LIKEEAKLRFFFFFPGGWRRVSEPPIYAKQGFAYFCIVFAKLSFAYLAESMFAKLSFAKSLRIANFSLLKLNICRRSPLKI